MATVTLVKLSAISLIFLICPLFSLGHLGHDHGHEEDHQHHDEIEETDPKWIKAQSLHGAGVTLKWISDDKETVTMKMSSKTEGYVAVGFCSRWLGTMEGCDIALGWVNNDNGTANLFDYHAPGNTLPVLDDDQNYELLEGSQANGVTTIIFKRKWDTGDEQWDADLEHNHVHVIFAWHSEDPTSKEEFLHHTVEGRGHTSGPISLKDGHDHHEGHASGAEVLSMTFSLSILIFCQLFLRAY